VGTFKDFVLDGLDIISPVPVGTVIRQVENISDQDKADVKNLARGVGEVALTLATAGAGVAAAKVLSRFSEDRCFVRPKYDLIDFIEGLTKSASAVKSQTESIACEIPSELTIPLLFMAPPFGAGAYFMLNELCPKQELHRVYPQFMHGEEVIRLPRQLIHGTSNFLREYEVPTKREMLESLIGPASLMFY